MPDMMLQRVQQEGRVRVAKLRRHRALAIAHPLHPAPEAALGAPQPERVLGYGTRG